MKKKNVLITGASRGLGRSLAQVFADREYDLILHSKKNPLPCINKSFCWTRNHTRGYDVNCETVQGDLSDMATLCALDDVVEDGLDVLIHNAGVHTFGTFEELNPSNYEQDLKVNLLAPMLLTRMLWDKVVQNNGLILFINSIAGKVGADKEFLYCTSKHGLKGFSDSLQFDSTKVGIKVMSVYLGALKTDMTKHRDDWDKLMEPADAANLIYDVCKNYKSMRITEIDVSRRNY